MRGLFITFFYLLLAQSALAQSTPNPALLVGEKSGAALAIVDPVSLEIIAHVPANPNPHEVATDGVYAYVSNSGATTITVIDLVKQEQVEGIDLHPIGPIHSLEMAAGKLYFANEPARTISRYDPVSKRIDWVLGTGIPRMHMIAVSEDAKRIFATSISGRLAAIIERPSDFGGRSSDWTITTIPTGPRAEGLDVSPDGQELWVTNVNDSTVSIIDINAKKEIDKLDLPTAFSNRLKFTLDGRYVFVAELQGNQIVVLDASTRKQVKRIDVGGGSEGILMAPDGERVFVAVSRANKVVVIDLDSLEIVGEVPGLINPDGMAWAEKP
ncbi:MAG: PQQ-binding-like beta-propeller repeat protein [Rhodothermaceae bacterium]|nr:PQQ-binding-like beta-propeller repeat protein [Rhodothermaceae bacterium]